jgi:hypothetical protein
VFIQVITGHMSDAGAFRRRWDQWDAELRPGAPGFLGGVGGVTPDGRGVLVARFSDEASARRNSDRPEQDAWWRETAACFAGDARFSESADVAVVHGEPTNASLFVQVMRAHCADRLRFEEVEAEIGPHFLAHRPDSLCALRLWYPDDLVTAVDWFTSVRDARAGEQKEPPAALAEGFGRWMALLSDHEWFDLPDPWHSAT